MSGLLHNVAVYASKIVETLAIKLKVAPTNEFVFDAINDVNSMFSIFNKTDTIYKRNKWLKERGYYIEATVISLGIREEQQYSMALQSMHSVLVEDKCYVVPIDILLAKILEQASSRITFPQCTPSSLPNKVQDFVDTHTFHRHSYLQRHQKTFLLHFFIDTFEVTNVLGSHTRLHKLEALYMMIRHIAPEYQSKTDRIFLVCLWYALDAHTDKYSYYPILHSVVSLLQQLESEQSIVVKVNGVEETIHAILI